MRYELFIGFRYLRAKRSEAFISLITAISMIGLIIGVMTLNIVLAVFTGFEEDLRDRILGFNPHVVVLSFGGPIKDYATVVPRIEAIPGVAAAAPYIYAQVMLSASQNVAGVAVRAVGPDSERVVNLQRLMKTGTVESLTSTRPVALSGGDAGAAHLPTLILGTGVAEKLHVGVGDIVNAIVPVEKPSAIGMAPRMKRFVVSGLFDSGMAEYDGALVYMDLAAAQRLFDLGSVATGIEVRLRDIFAARAVTGRIMETLGFPYRARDWMEINHNLFAALRVGKTVYFIVVLLIVLVAAFNVVAMLIMVVMEKRRDIAVLKSLGATRAGVGRIFIFKGMIIGTVGTLVGNLGALLVCQLLKHYRFIELPRDVYSIDRLQVRLYPEYFVAVTVAALLLCLLATIYPARQAARLSPVDVIRYE